MIGATGDCRRRSKIWPVVPAPLLIKIRVRDPNIAKMVASEVPFTRYLFAKSYFFRPIASVNFPNEIWRSTIKKQGRNQALCATICNVDTRAKSVTKLNTNVE